MAHNKLTVHCPGSKSMTQRALMIASLADGPSVIEYALRCDDSRHLSALLTQLGVKLCWEGDQVEVTPRPLVADGEVHYCGNAGTAVRFSCCLSLLCGGGALVIDGDERMRERPIGRLAGALERLGVAVRYLGTRGCPPISLRREGPTPGEVELDVSISSQYASGLLLVAPRLKDGLRLLLKGAAVSRPYLDMTVEMMRGCGAELRWQGANQIVVAPGCYRGGKIAIEPDWSTAAFLLAAGRIADVDLAIPNLEREKSLQGDVAFVEFLAQLSQAHPHRFDLQDTPDLIAPLAAAALFADYPTEIRNVAHARVKECDRIRVLAEQLARIGAEVREYDDGLQIAPLKATSVAPIELDPANDHRMAMAFGLVSLRVDGVSVADPECVDKSFPSFWAELRRIKQAMRGA